MTDEMPAAPTTPPPPAAAAVPAAARTKTKLADILFGWKSAVVIFIGGLILGGLGGAGIGTMGHHHHQRGDRIAHLRGGPGGYGYGGYGYGGGVQGGGGYGVPGGVTPVPPGVQQAPAAPKPSSGSSPKAAG